MIENSISLRTQFMISTPIGDDFENIDNGFTYACKVSRRTSGFSNGSVQHMGIHKSVF